MKRVRLISLLGASIFLFAFTGCTKTTNNTLQSDTFVEAVEKASSSDATEASTVPSAQVAPSAEAVAKPVGDFSAVNLKGESITPSIFAGYDLTLVNVFATWCSPCVAEMPELEKISQSMKENSLQVIGIVLDAGDASNVEATMMPIVEELVSKTGVTYPVLIPDDVLLSGVLRNVNSIPMTFFVDRDGNIVGEEYLGARSEAQWMKIIETEKAKVSTAS